MPKELKFIVSPLLVACFLVLSFVAGFSLALKEQPVLDAWNILKHDYVDQTKLDWKLLFLGLLNGVDGMLEQLDDPYSAYFNAEEYSQFYEEIAGSFIGIGVELIIDQDGNLMVIAPISGSPAEDAGIEPGDIILTIDGVSTSGVGLWDSVLQIRGEEGTQVTLEVRHQDGKTEQITITREEISIPTVSGQMLANDIAYIGISHFSENTGTELHSSLEQALNQGAQGIILDLRNNPGGLIDAAVSVASQFLPEGSTVLTARDGYGNETTWKAEAGGLATDFGLPLVVLVNGFSASSSEVVAGALQDYERATLIGTKTYGKGSVNLLHSLSDGSALYVTHGRWYTPNGRLIEGVGLTPDNIDKLDDYPQLKQAVEDIMSS